MITQAAAVAALAAATLVLPDRAVSGSRLAALARPPAPEPLRGNVRRPSPVLRPMLGAAVAALVTALVLPFAAVPAAAAGWWLGRRACRPRDPVVDPFRLAATWELFGSALRAGLPVPVAVRATAADLPGPPGAALRATADLLGAGTDPVRAWEPVLACPDTAALARAARRSVRSGAALAGAAAALAEDLRTAADATAEARAQRAAVLICGPLGLCFLPAFVCLGIVPVVAGLAEGLGLPR